MANFFSRMGRPQVWYGGTETRTTAQLRVVFGRICETAPSSARIIPRQVALIWMVVILACQGCASLHLTDPHREPELFLDPPLQTKETIREDAEKRYAYYRQRLDQWFILKGSPDVAGREIVAHQVENGTTGYWADAMVVQGWYLAVLATE